MFGFLTARWQTAGGSEKARPSWYDRHLAPVLLSVAKKACTHPIHTIVTIAFLASYSYLGVLDKGLLVRDTDKVTGKVDFNTLLAGSQRLRGNGRWRKPALVPRWKRYVRDISRGDGF
jgi:hydroxymethylglutaryl-CoA reductase (NADPH)